MGDSSIRVVVEREVLQCAAFTWVKLGIIHVNRDYSHGRYYIYAFINIYSQSLGQGSIALLRFDLTLSMTRQRLTVCCSVLQCVAVCCSVLQCVAVCCSVLQCVAVRCLGLT